MNNQQLKIDIARDVLLQLKSNRFLASPGTYCQISNDLHVLDQGVSFKEVFTQKQSIKCNVCALGAMFVSLINIQNEYSVGKMTHYGIDFRRLREVFGSRSMSLIESAFETTPMRDVVQECVTTIPQSELEAAATWGSRYLDSTDRMRAIMKNIIRNKGDFKLPKKLMRARSLA